MPVPHAVARFNKRYTNRFIEPVVRRLPGFAVVHHIGRRSGTNFATPIRLFARGDGSSLVVLTYGERADWVRNVIASGGEIQDSAGRHRLRTVELVDRDAVAAELPAIVRLATRVLRIDQLLRLEH